MDDTTDLRALAEGDAGTLRVATFQSVGVRVIRDANTLQAELRSGRIDLVVAAGAAEAAGWDGGKTILDDYLREVRPLFAAGIGDHTIVTTLCPGGKERMRRLVLLPVAAALGEAIRAGQAERNVEPEHPVP